MEEIPIYIKKGSNPKLGTQTQVYKMDDWFSIHQKIHIWDTGMGAHFKKPINYNHPSKDINSIRRTASDTQYTY